MVEMDSIKKAGQQSFMLNTFKNVCSKGIPITFFLNVKLSNQPKDKNITQTIRIHIFKSLKGVHHTFTIHGEEVRIKWMTSATRTSVYYYTTDDYLDEVVAEHTKMLLNKLIGEINPLTGSVFTTGPTGLTFLVSKPLRYAASTLTDEAYRAATKQELVAKDEEVE